jgi:hypothetical protein
MFNEKYVLRYTFPDNKTTYYLDISDVTFELQKSEDYGKTWKLVVEHTAPCNCSPEEKDVMQNLGRACELSCGRERD